MITNSQKVNFLNSIVPIINSVARERGYLIVSPIIAQACLESGYGTSGLSKYFNFFGMKCGSSWKGKSVRKLTKEEYVVGAPMTVITSDFRAYDDIESGVRGYFDFISMKRYENLKQATTPQKYVETIVADGYCTDSKYVTKIMNIIKENNLEKYDNIPKSQNPYKAPIITLRVGSKGNGVKWLQYELIHNGFMPALNSKGKTNIDGEYGELTKSSVLAFQKSYFKNSKEWDGICGSKTRNALKS